MQLEMDQMAGCTIHSMIALSSHAIGVRGILVGVQVNSIRLQWHLGQVGPRVGACLSTGRRARPGGRGAPRCRSGSCYRRSLPKGLPCGKVRDRALRIAVGKGWARWRGSRGYSSESAGVVAVWALRTSRKNTMAARKETPMLRPAGEELAFFGRCMNWFILVLSTAMLVPHEHQHKSTVYWR